MQVVIGRTIIPKKSLFLTHSSNLTRCLKVFGRSVELGASLKREQRERNVRHAYWRGPITVASYKWLKQLVCDPVICLG